MSPYTLTDLTDDALFSLEAVVTGAIFADEEVEIVLGDDYAQMPEEIVQAIGAHFDPLLEAIEAEQSRRVELNFRCLDCDVHTGEIGQYPYRCPDELWQAVVPGGRGMLCLPCLAKRLAAAGLPWPWREPAERMAAKLLEIVAPPDNEPQGEQLTLDA